MSPWLPFAVDAVSFVAAGIGAALIHRPLGPDRASHIVRAGVRHDVREGARFVARHGFLRYMTGWIALTNMVGNSFLLILIARLRYRSAGPQLIGLTSSAVVAAGFVGTALTGRLIRILGAHRVFGAGGSIYVISLGLAALAPRAWTIALSVSLFVFASVPTAPVWEAYTTLVVPDRLVGRVGAVFTFASQSLTWIGLLLVGWLCEMVGAPSAVLCFAVALLPFAVAGHVAQAVSILKTQPETPVRANDASSAG